MQYLPVPSEREWTPEEQEEFYARQAKLCEICRVNEKTTGRYCDWCIQRGE